MIEIDGYAVGPEIGRGGFGVVYRATQLALNRPVAIKVLHSAAGSAAVQREFAKECRAVGALRSHPNVLSVYSTGTTRDGAPYLAMQLLTGGSLAERAPLAPEAVAELGIRLTRGLQAAHTSGVIHRDVKPSNVLFNVDDEPVLVDFGISSVVGDATTRSGNIAISIGYTPPEVLDGHRPGVAADIYALGATLFTALTGRVPFVVDGGFSSIAVLAARIVSQPVEDLRPLGVPDALCLVLERAMAKEPADRFGSMAEMGAALDPVADNATVRSPKALWGVTAPNVANLVTQPGTTGRIRNTVRTHRVGSAVAAAALVAAAVGTSVALAASGSSSRSPVADTGRQSSLSGSASHSPSVPTSVATSSAVPRSIQPVKAPVTSRVVRATAPNGQIVTRTVAVPPQQVVAPPPVVNGGVRVDSRARTTPPNHAPAILVSSTALDELARPPASLASDPDSGDTMTIAVTGTLPPGVYRSGAAVTGTVSANASTGRTTYTQAPTTRAYTFTVRATDSHGASASRTVTWTVRDTAFVLPDYIGKFGGEYPIRPNGMRHEFDCAYPAPGAPSGSVWRQSVAPQTVLAWATADVHFWYASDTPTSTDGFACQNVAKGW